ncbi:fumarylacetoacetate hydrolase family protein [Pseudomaricurvus alkylphenolicus]|uniref:fumarylacetoacetate hydrolase family protein n=1 Tax=Pseudomaricurvus alkylphenolicus TaxID=1306991 RepID=UPI001421CF33|nr:fumarylacetoacetate hydrolase family protein [Pseudomaricurvus alkylphenolicus]NIB42732.1 fumarylacetoacetate hydrolase family protein [Pseudomaricurvus alkylphenolicus]
MTYQHQWQDGSPMAWSPGKVVCVGRNYADHARELNNPVPAEPLLFIKPASALVPLAEPIELPRERGDCHIETEMSLLIGSPLSRAGEDEALEAIAGVGIGFDLTLRELQSKLKQKGHPWELAKAFDGSCPLSVFVRPEGLDWGSVQLQLIRNGQLQQNGNSAAMITPVASLLSYISQHFSLQPGDVVLTGTPAGVGPLSVGDQLQVKLDDRLEVTTRAR